MDFERIVSSILRILLPFAPAGWIADTFLPLKISAASIGKNAEIEKVNDNKNFAVLFCI